MTSVNEMDLMGELKKKLGPEYRIKCNCPIPGDLLGQKGKPYDWKCIEYLEKNNKTSKLNKEEMELIK